MLLISSFVGKMISL